MIMLRLNQDQECYERMSKWAVTSVQSLYRDELPILHDDSISTNVFEDNSPLWSRTEELAVVATVALLKIKLLIDLKALDTTTRLVGSKVPREILDHVRGYIPTSPIIAENQTIIRRDNHQETIRDLTDQICVMVKRILFLRIAYRCDLAPFRAVAGGMRADPRKTSELVRYSHVCWAEVPGAEGFVRNIEARFDRGELEDDAWDPTRMHQSREVEVGTFGIHYLHWWDTGASI